MTTPALSVAMSVYNNAPYVGAAIESILSQSEADFEFLILDDGSQDGSSEIIAGYAARDSRLRVITRENRGLIASLNELLMTARAPLVARMDADDISLPQRFERQLAFLADHPDHGVVGSLTEDIDEHGAPYPLVGTGHSLSHEAFLAAIALRGPLLCHPSVMYRREVVLGVGGYHAAFHHCEDLDLWLRLAGVTRICSLPERLLRYRHTAEQVSSRHLTEQKIGAAVAYLAYGERAAGRPDPTENLTSLPPLEELDVLFGRAGVAREVRSYVAPSLLYSKAGLGDHGFDLMMRHLRDGGLHDGMWRAVARLVRLGDPVRAARLATTLTLTTFRAV